MITENELNISNQSYTKKDFYQIYPEILDLARKLSERWDPQYSNESDPGVVLLKLLAFIADKNNYNIDKTILEAFMPSATQQESMRKLCDMMGYNMKYIQSATTEVSFMWNSDEGSLKSDLDSIDGNYILLPKYFTNLKDSESTVNYVLLEDVKLTHRYETVKKQAIEGTYVEFEINSDNVVLASNLDENNRLYLPETEIAENGIFITTVGQKDPDWHKVDNLNIKLAGQRVWKFGFDSLRQRPYIQFPDDVFKLIPNGFKVAYIRSSGINGNIPARKLNSLDNNELTIYASDDRVAQENGEDLKVSAADGNLTIANLSSTNNGSNVEDLDSAYKNFKRTVGTFETLINCRDYANAIYEMVKDETYDNNPLVSNIQVGDVSNDLNYSHRITTFDGYGISDKIIDDSMEEVDVYEGSYINPVTGRTGTFNKGKAKVKGLGKFNIYLYPLNAIKAYNEKQFNQSFNPNQSNIYEIKNQLQSKKSLNHKINTITGSSEAFLIKNYYDLNGKIITNRKLSNYEVIQVQQAVYTALYKNFNARELNYGEKIPYDKLVDVMINADARIKAINLDDPKEETFILFAKASSGVQEYKLSYENSSDRTSKDWYLKFVARNVLAGRAPLFNYDKDFKVKYNQTVASDSNIYGHTFEYSPSTKSYYKYMQNESTSSKDCNVTYIKTNLEIPITYDTATAIGKFGSSGHILQENEQVQLLSNRLATQVTYPAYVNYFLHLEGASGADSIPAYLRSLDNLGQSVIAKKGDIDYPYYYLYYWLDRYKASGSDIKSEDIDTIPKALAKYKSLVDQQTAVSDSHGRPAVNRRATFYKESILKSSYPGVLCSVNQHKYTQWTNYSNLGLATEVKSLAERPTENQWLIWKGITEQTATGLKTTYSLEKVFEGINGIDPNTGEDTYGVIKYISSIYENLGFTTDKVDDLKRALATKVNDSLAAELNKLGFNRLENTSEYERYGGYSGVWSTDWKSVAGTGVGSTQYKIDYCNYSIGINGHSDGIAANTLYELRNGDKLYINYTDSDDVIHNILYEKERITDNGIIIAEGANELQKQSGLNRLVIKVNFDIKDSDRYSTNHTYAKTSGFLSDWSRDIVGMFSLGTSDEIRIMKTSTTKITSNSNWYWTTPSNKLIFTKVSENDANSSATYSVILEDGEYVYYTDQAKSSLLTLGSGTELKFTTKSSAAKEGGKWKNNLIWHFEESVADKVTTDAILEDGLAAFGSLNWQTCPFNGIPFSEDNYLEINILDVKTFSEGDYLESISSPVDIDYINSKKWTSINQITVNNQQQCTNISADSDGSVLSSLGHRIRSILNINIGPDLVQNLSSHKDDDSGRVANVTQEFEIYSSYFTTGGSIDPIPNDKIKDYFENIDSRYEEHIGKKEMKKWVVYGQNDDIQLKSNVNIQKTGNWNTGVPVHTYSISMVRSDSAKIYQIKEEAPKYMPRAVGSKEQTLQINNFDHIYTKVDFKTCASFYLPIYVPRGQFGLIAIYYTPDENLNIGPALGHDKCKIYDINNLDEERYGVVPDQKILILKVGEVEPGAKLMFRSRRGTDGILLIKDLDIVKPNSETDKYGFNEKYLGITNGSADLYKVIKDLDPENDFYWNMPIDNSNILDEDSLDSPAAWSNKNNILSRYMLPQLNTDSFSNIVVAKSCRINS